MATGDFHPHQHRFIFRGLDRSLERALGMDGRLLYGMGVPMLMIVGLVIVLALNPATWIVAVIVVLEMGALVLIVSALLEMMRDDQNEEG
ncbi:MAG: hypothetical protein ACYCXW_18750 [Solirubrobacteraceae bacterium]